MIILKSFDCQKGNYKLTSQCENTISSVFTLLQSNNTLLIQNLNKFRKFAGGAPAPPLATALARTVGATFCGHK